MNMAVPRICPVSLDSKLEVGRDEASIDRLSAVMLFPDAPDDQVEYLRDLFLPRHPSNPQSSPLSGRVNEGVNNGVVAGSCLMYFRLLEQSKIRSKAGKILEPSQRAAFNICGKFNLGRGRTSDEAPNDGFPPLNRGTTLPIWDGYKRVSHLWAAYIHLKLDGVPCYVDLQEVVPPDDDSQGHVLDCVDVSVLVFLARQYERFANEFFDGEDCGRFTRENFSPFRARYCDWNNDDVLVMDIPKLDHITNWATDAAASYDTGERLHSAEK